jgi:hypothetical protein
VVSQQTDAAFQVTGELAVTVDRALTLDSEGQEKTTFRPGDGIWYAVIVRNSGPPVDVTFTWQGQHADPAINAEIYAFTNTVTLGREFSATVYSPATIPTDAPIGLYLNRETVTVGGQEFVRESQFEVVSQEAPTPTPTPVPPELGRLRVIKALSMPTTSLFVGQNVTVSFTVKNVGGSTLHLEELAAAVRRGSDWNGEEADFPPDTKITLEPEEEHVYNQSRSFDTAGDYFAEPVVKMNGQWGGIENANRVYFTVQIPKPAPTPIPPRWLSPESSFLINRVRSLELAARASPTKPGDLAIDHVNFTAKWPGADWRVVCTASQPAQVSEYKDEYRCKWGLPNVPNGPLIVSYDVYDKAGNSYVAPEGPREGMIQLDNAYQGVEWDDTYSKGRKYSLKSLGLVRGCKPDEPGNRDWKYEIAITGNHNPDQFRIYSTDGKTQQVFEGKDVMGVNLTNASQPPYLCIGIRDINAAGGHEKVGNKLFVWLH